MFLAKLNWCLKYAHRRRAISREPDHGKSQNYCLDNSLVTHYIAKKTITLYIDRRRLVIISTIILSGNVKLKGCLDGMICQPDLVIHYKSARVNTAITKSYMILESGRHVMGDRTGSICHYKIMAN